MAKVGFAVVGYGNIGRRHVEFLNTLDGARIVTVCDIIKERAEEGCKAAKDGGAVPTYDLKDVLADPQVDVVDLCTPSGLHAKMAMDAMKAGKHALSEKPMALTLAEADGIIKTEREQKVKYFLVKQNRYNPPVAVLKQQLDRGALGEIFFITSNVFWNRRKAYFDESPWRGTLALDGGALLTQCSHFIDLILWLQNDPVRVDARMMNMTHPYTEAEDTGTVRIEFKNGCIAVMNYTTSTYEKNQEGSIAVLGTKGFVKIGGKYLDEIAQWNVEGVPLPELPPSSPPNIYKGGYQGSMSNHDKVLMNVIAVLTKGESNAVTSSQGRLTVEVMQAAHISALKKKPVELPLKGKDYRFDMRKTKPFQERE